MQDLIKQVNENELDNVRVRFEDGSWIVFM